MADTININILDLAALIESSDDVIHHNDGTFEVPAGSGKLYQPDFDMPVTSEWGKQVLEDAKHVDLRES